MRTSDFFGDETDDFRDGNDLRSPESLKSVYPRPSVFPDHLERISNVLRECVMDLPTGRPAGQSLI